MLRVKEQADIAARMKEKATQDKMLIVKAGMQKQMLEQEKLREQANEEYQKERAMVDATINRMIQEDLAALELEKAR